MKISKSLIQTIALAVTITTVGSSCKKDDTNKPKEKTLTQVPYNCPACGMG